MEQMNNMQPQEYVRPLMSATIGDLLRKWAREIPDNECVVYPQGQKRWTWKQFDELTDVVARGFMAMGVNKGDKIAIWATERARVDNNLLRRRQDGRGARYRKYKL